MLISSTFEGNLFDDFFDFPFFDGKEQKKLERKLYDHRGKNLMKTDIKKTDSDCELEMGLPGFTKNEVKVSLKDGILAVSVPKGFDQDGQEGKTGGHIRRKRYAEAYKRSFYAGEDLTEADIEGEFEHGVPKLFVLKKEAELAVEEKKYVTIGQ